MSIWASVVMYAEEEPRVSARKRTAGTCCRGFLGLRVLGIVDEISRILPLPLTCTCPLQSMCTPPALNDG